LPLHQQQALTFDAGSSTSATYGFVGGSFVNFVPTLKTGIPVDGGVFSNCGEINFKGTTVVGATVVDTVSTDAAIAFTETGGSYTGTIDATGTVYSAGILAAGFSSTTGIHSTLQSAGSFASAFLETVGAPTFDASKNKVVYTGTTNVSWTLPTASTCTGREYILHHANTSGTITLSQSVTSGNGANFNTIAPGQWAFITSTGSGWRGYKVTSL